MKYNILAIGGAIVNTLPRLFDMATGKFLTTSTEYSAGGMEAFFKMQALSFVLILAAQYYPVQKHIHSSILILAVSNLFDEFIDPTHLGLSEMITAIAIIGYNVYEYRRKRTV